MEKETIIEKIGRIITKIGTVFGEDRRNAQYGDSVTKNKIFKTTETGLPKYQLSLNMQIKTKFISEINSPHTKDHFMSVLRGVYVLASIFPSAAAPSQIIQKCIIENSTPDIVLKMSFEYEPTKSRN